MIQIFAKNDDGETFWTDCPDAVRVEGTPLALIPYTLNGITGWRPLHIPSGHAISNQAWNSKERGLLHASVWYSAQEKRIQEMLESEDCERLIRDIWDNIATLFLFADMELA